MRSFRDCLCNQVINWGLQESQAACFPYDASNMTGRIEHHTILLLYERSNLSVFPAFAASKYRIGPFRADGQENSTGIQLAQTFALAPDNAFSYFSLILRGTGSE